MTETTGPSTAASPTAASPTARQLWTRSRGLLIALTILVVAGIALAAVRSGEQHGRLDPRSADRFGSRAVAQLLAERGVTTQVVTTTQEALAAAGPRTTVLVSDPDRLTRRQQTRLHNALADSTGRTVLLAPGDDPADTFAPGVRAAARTDVTIRPPDCSFAAAERAGDAELGGIRYDSSAPGTDACYPSRGLPTLLRIPGANGSDTVLLGTPDILYNDRLAKRGNASLALQLLGSQPHLVWYLPSVGDSAAGGNDRSFLDLVPAGWTWAFLQLAIAAALAALWRARRLGPLVTEPLPVTVHASEATEGRARLYRQADARDRAADALRSAARSRLAPLVGVPAARAHDPELLLPAVTGHLTDHSTDAATLLFGPPPPDDRALVRLPEDLDALERRITSGTGQEPHSAPTPAEATPPTERDRTP
ncbi:DUF4350 domain-containing protein [Streptomyces sp. NPDC001922]|uniref:DUF4350 domain-containing protein n=1 Tax=Streptomyces sp. NPDC001922 TaxID=3364624 RepID=UPI00367B3F2F